MEKYPSLTLSRLSQSTDRELQTNYLNRLDRTDEIASLLSQIIDRDLALHIIDLALEVDLGLGASLVGHLATDLQVPAVKTIDDLDICIGLKVELWAKTKSQAALPYLKDVFVFKHPQEDPDYLIIRSLAVDAIIGIDRDLAATLLIESLLDDRFTNEAINFLYELAPVEAIEPLRMFLNHPESEHHYDWRERSISILDRIGTGEAIETIRDVMYAYRGTWYEHDWIYGLAIVREPEMVECLIYLLHFPSEYIYRSDDNIRNRDKAARLCRETIAAIERIGGDLAFEILHRAIYWIDILDGYLNQIDLIISILARIDCERTLTALEGAIHSHDPVVRRRAAMALGIWDIRKRHHYSSDFLSNGNLPYFTDRNLSILLNAIEDPDPLVGLEITDKIDQIYRVVVVATHKVEGIEVTQELWLLAQTKVKEVLIGYLSHPDSEIRDKAIEQLVHRHSDIVNAIAPLLNRSCDSDDISIIRTLDPSINQSILLEYLEHEDVSVRAAAFEKLCKSNDDSVLPILSRYLNDKESIIAESAAIGIVRLGSVSTLPLLLEIAANPKLVITLIETLLDLDHEECPSRLLENLKNDRAFTRQLIDTAETTLFELLDTRSAPNGAMLCFYWLGSDNDRVVDKIAQILRLDECTYDEEDDGVRALAKIGTDRAILALLSLLPNQYVLGSWISTQLEIAGKLGIIPRLWIAQRQIYDRSLSDAIALIQTREGLYNPDFSNKSYPLYERSKSQLRDLLLGDVWEGSRETYSYFKYISYK
jgi:HEAT repeat protein